MVDDFTDLLTSPGTKPAQPKAAETTAGQATATQATPVQPVTPPSTEPRAGENSVATATDVHTARALPEAVDPFDNTPVRTWHDNTGNFEVTGRLVDVQPDAVRLLKDNGRFTTVPLRRLSPVDRQYVDQTINETENKSRNGKFISAT